MILYYYRISENTFITHDGYVQLGFYNTKIEDFLIKTSVKYIETYWIPDIFTKRYKRTNYQHHLNSASIGTKDDEHLRH